MRLLLFIPVLVLFLSNVPFVQEMKMDEAMTMMQDEETCPAQKKCGKNENLKGICEKQETSCDQQSTCSEEEINSTTNKDLVNDNKCCQKTETTCVCICCFQFAAPVQVVPEFKFDCSVNSNTPPAFIVGYIKDPHIGAPWQPPDFV